MSNRLLAGMAALIFWGAPGISGAQVGGRPNPTRESSGSEVTPVIAVPARPDTYPASPSGAAPGASPAAAPDNWTIYVRVAEVSVPFTVTDRGKVVEDVREQDVSIADNDKPAENIVYFGRLRSLPLRLGLLIDSSDSIIQRSHFEEQAASNFVHQVLNPDIDRAFVVGFNNRNLVILEETADLEKLDAAIVSLNPLGRTALFDAVYAGCKKLADARAPNRVARILVLISDGDDNSSKATLAQTIAMAQSAEVIVFAISTQGSRSLFSRKSRGDSALIKLAEETGGRAFFADTAKELTKAFAALETEMRNRYVIFYRPSDLEEDGRHHRIQVSVRREGKQLRVYARKGYYARMPAATN